MNSSTRPARFAHFNAGSLHGLIALVLALSATPACFQAEGTSPGDCSDGADNDGDGKFDCEDDGCAGAQECKKMQAGFISGGELTRAFAATGALTAYKQPFCTATLVAPQTVLTAAHCVTTGTFSGVQFALGANLADTGLVADVAAAEVHPQWYGDFQAGNDLAVLTLATPITDVAPVSLGFDDTSSLAGQTMTLVGYGSTEDGMSGAGIRRMTDVTIKTVTPQTLMYVYDGSGACKGDSGGPAFIQVGSEWRQVGVTSWGDVPCVGQGHYQRIDIHRDWLVGQGVPGAPRTLDCAGDGACDGGCKEDEDCWDLVCPSGSCTAPSGTCVANGTCEPQCGVSDPDCENHVDPCAQYGLYGNGWCDPQCPNDPDCAGAGVGGYCAPVAFQFDPYTFVCTYVDAYGHVCGQQYAFCDPYYGCRC